MYPKVQYNMELSQLNDYKEQLDVFPLLNAIVDVCASLISHESWEDTDTVELVNLVPYPKMAHRTMISGNRLRMPKQ